MTDINQQTSIYQTTGSLSESVAGMIEQWAAKAIAQSGQFHLVLSGGSTPAQMYRDLARKKDRIDWTSIHFWFGDERCVPPDHPDSNYRMARETLFDPADVPPENVHRIQCEKSPEQAASLYAQELARYAEPGQRWPPFDVVLLGLGEDGHTASLFPGTDVLGVQDRPVAAVYVEKFESWRVSLTYPALNSARRVLFLVAGENKADIVSELTGENAQQYPAGRIHPQGELIWCLDKAAARL